MYPMPLLQGFFDRHAPSAGARWWIGARPPGSGDRIARTIAERLGYPAGYEDPFTGNGMRAVGLADAAYVLATAASTSLVFDSGPNADMVAEAREALRDLRDRPCWMVNGWLPALSRSWTPMSAATFDCGVIGYDAQNAFIFWTEEED